MPKEEGGWLCDHQSQILFYLTRSVKVNIKPPVKMSKITAGQQTSKLYFQNSTLFPAMFSLENTMLRDLKWSILPPSRRRNIGWCWPRSTPLPPSGFFPLLTSQSSWHLIATHSLPLSHKSEEKDPQAATSHNTPWVTQPLSHLPSFKSRSWPFGWRMSLLVFKYCLFDIKPYWNLIYV